MTPYDATIAGVVIGGMIWGAIRGLSWQLASVASLVLGYAAAHTFSQQLAPHLPGEALAQKALAMVILYVGVAGAIHLAAWSARATLKKMKFEAYDRHLGMVLGGVEGMFLGVIGTIFVVGLSPSTRGPILNSPSGKIVSAALETCQPALPAEYRNMLTKYWNPQEAAVSPAATVASEPQVAPQADQAANSTEPAPAPAATVSDSAALSGDASLEDQIKGKVKDVLKREGSKLEREATTEIERRIERLGGRNRNEQSDTAPRR